LKRNFSGKPSTDGENSQKHPHGQFTGLKRKKPGHEPGNGSLTEQFGKETIWFPLFLTRKA
jgi:hypothetical protein